MSQGGSIGNGGGGGGGTVSSLTPDVGAAVPGVAGTIPTLGYDAGTVQTMRTYNDGAGNFRIANQTWETQYVVDISTTDGLRGTFTTIQAAMDQAVLDGMTFENPKKILIRPGSYVENLNIRQGAYLQGTTIPANPMSFVAPVFIQGNHTLDTLGIFSSDQITWQTTVGDMFVGGSSFVIAQWTDSLFQNTDGYIFNCSGSAFIEMINCQLYGVSNGTVQFNVPSLGGFSATNCQMNGTAFSFSGQVPVFEGCTNIGNVLVGSQPIIANNCSFVGFGAACITQTSGQAGQLRNCYFTCGNTSELAYDFGTATPPFLIDCSCIPINTPISDFTNAVSNDIASGGYQQTLGNVLRGVRATADYVCADGDAYVGVGGIASPITITLPANPFVGQQVYVVDEEASASLQTITVTSSSFINGVSTYTITTNYQGALFRCIDGTNWITLLASSISSSANLVSPDIDLTTSGVTPLAVTSASGAFVTSLYTLRAINMNTVTMDGNFNIGTNAPDYDNIVSGSAMGITVSDTSITNMQGNFGVVVPANTQINVNIVLPMTATTGVGRFYLTGITN